MFAVAYRGWLAILLLIVAVGVAPVAAEPGSVPEAAGRELMSTKERTDLFEQIDRLRLSAHPDSALPLLERWIETARAAGDSMLLLDAILRYGATRVGWGEASASEPNLREAAGISEALRDTVSMCVALRWLSVAVSVQGRHSEARELCRRLMSLAHSSGDRQHEGWALVGLGWFEEIQGDNDAAAQLYRQAVVPFEQARHPEGVAWAYDALGRAHYHLGDYDLSAHFREQAIAAADSIGFVHQRHYMLNNLLNNQGALAYSIGDPATAEHHFRRAYELQRARGDLPGAIVPGMNTAMCQMRLGRLDDAEAHLDTLAATCREHGLMPLLGRVQTRRATLRHQQGRWREATALFREVLALGDALPRAEQIGARILLSQSLAQIDSTREALEVLKGALDLVTGSIGADILLDLYAALAMRLQEQDRPHDALAYAQRVAREAARLGLRKPLLPALYTAARCHEALGAPDSAAVYFDRAVAAWKEDRALPLDPEWREERGARGRALYQGLVAFHLNHLVALPPAERAGRAYDSVRMFKARTLMERALGPGRVSAAAVIDSLAPPPTLETLQREVLQPRELLLDAFWGPSALYIFAVTRDSCRVVHHSAVDDLERRITLVARALSDPSWREAAIDENTLQEMTAALSHRLLGDLADLIDAHGRIILSPDGVLNRLPLEALPSPRSDGRRQPFSQTHEIVREPSAAFLAWQRRGCTQTESPTPATLLGVRATRGAWGAALPGAEEEVQRLERGYRGVDIYPSATNGRSLRGLLPGYQILHFAAHTEADDQYPWRSAIVCDSAGTTLDLRADQVSRLRLEARLAMLSSCRTAGGRVLSGEGVLGLSSAFLCAGVEAVVASLWDVPDRPTARLVERFYAALADGHGAAAALARARAVMRSDPATRHPYYWAGFVLVGDGDVRLALEPRPLWERHRWLLPLLLLLLLAAVAALVRRRRKAGATIAL